MAEFTGHLAIKNNKKGKQYFVSYTNAKGKVLENKIEIGSSFPYSEEEFVDGLEVKVILENGLLKKCVIEGKSPLVSDEQIQQKKDEHKQKAIHNNEIKKLDSNNYRLDALRNATAPYNFISYDENSISLMEYPQDPPIQQLYSGTIKCSLKSLSKLLVAARSGRDSTDRKFLEIDELPVIPGTSLKGMIRSLVEVMSFSAMNSVSSENIFWRNLTGDEKSDYKKYFLIDERGKTETIYGGFLKQIGSQFYLYPADVSKATKNKKAQSGEKIVSVVGPAPKDKEKHYYLFKKKNCAEIELDSSIFEDFKLQRAQSKAQESKWNEENYESLIKKDGVPVFYCKEGSSIFAIGLARFFRIPYDQTPRDLVKPSREKDFVKHLFGKTDKDSSLKGRVCFSHLQFKPNTFVYSPKIKANLLEPHPSCLAHYLIQNSAKQQTTTNKTDADTLLGYNKKYNPQIRGRKYYWHRDYEKTEITGNGNENVCSNLFPVEPGAKGEFCVYVDRVNSVELGALLCALQLNSDFAHKLGTGKALGFGSVRIDVQSIDIKSLSARYSSLEDRFSNFAKTDNRSEDINKYIDEFKSYVVSKIGKGKTSKDYDNLKEIQELYHILNYNNRPDNSKTETMALDNKGGTSQNFKNKAILKELLEVN